MFKRVLNMPLLHEHISYAQNLRLPLMKSRSTNSLCDQNDYSQMKWN